MKKSIKDAFEIAGHEIDFCAVDYSLKDLPAKLSSLVRGRTKDQIEKIVYDSLKKQWNGIERGSKEFVCYKEQDGVLYPQHVEAGRGIPFYPCVFILKCNLFMAAGKDIRLRIKINKTGQIYNWNLYGVTYEYKVSELFVCDELGNSLLGFSQMPFPMDLKSLFLSLSRACGKVSLTKEDERNISKNVYESWIRHGMLDSEQPLIKDTARHLTFETGLQTKDGRNVQVILWKDAATDNMYEFRVVMGMSSLEESQRVIENIDERTKKERQGIRGADAIPVRSANSGITDMVASPHDGEIVPSVGEEIANAIGVHDPKSDQSKEKTVGMFTDTAQRANDAASVMSFAPTTRETTEITGAVTEPNVTPKKEAIIEEKEFLERFVGFVRACGYQYETRDLIRFHTCAKCGFFTLLGGEPGTGKSSLAVLYAKAIAGTRYEDKHQLLRIDVNPGWMEPADLMGYYSPSKDDFIESEVGLVSFLKKAQEDAKPRMVCFEEMNLAYVEHYFSDFIQQMSRANGDRAVAIKKQGGICEPISLNDNLRFVGTINFDETTKELSARFYDRCNYIELSPAGKTFPRLHSPVKNDILCEGDEIPSKVFNEWVDNAWEGKIDGWIMDLLDEVYPILQSLHIAPNWRKARDIYRYIASRPQFPAEESEDVYKEIEIKKGEMTSKIKVSNFDLNVLDEVIAQSILPVYRRPNEFREKEQNALLRFLNTKELKLSANMFTRIINESEVPYPDET